MDRKQEQNRKRILSEISADKNLIDSVFEYCNNPFSAERIDKIIFPLPDEPHVLDWKEYLSECKEKQFACLQGKLPQLKIPIRKGMSQTEEYSEVARRGGSFDEKNFGGKLTLRNPELFKIEIFRHPAGSLPLLLTSDREDFKTLIQALANRSEPMDIKDSVNAMLVSGFINWDRVRKYQTNWLTTGNSEKWNEEMQRVASAEPWHFKDKFILLCEAPYSGVSAAELKLGIDESEWLKKSTVLRIEHEFTHYATKRIFDKMRNNLLDELIADFMGMTKALGTFRADWFISFLGLSNYPVIKPEARAGAYRQDLDAGAFDLLCKLVIKAGTGLENIYRDQYSPSQRERFFLALTNMTLELFASYEACDIFRSFY